MLKFKCKQLITAVVFAVTVLAPTVAQAVTVPGVTPKNGPGTSQLGNIADYLDGYLIYGSVVAVVGGAAVAIFGHYSHLEKWTHKGQHASVYGVAGLVLAIVIGRLLTTVAGL